MIGLRAVGMVRIAWALMLVAQVLSLRAEEPRFFQKDEFLVQDASGRKEFVLTVEPAIARYLESVDPDRIRFEGEDYTYFLHRKIPAKLTIDGIPVDFAFVAYTYDQKVDEVEADEDREENTKPARKKITIEMFQSMSLLMLGDYGSLALSWLTDATSPYGCDLVIVPGKKFKIVEPAGDKRGRIEVGEDGDIAEMVNGLPAAIREFTKSGAAQTRKAEYFSMVEGMPDAMAILRAREQAVDEAAKFTVATSQMILDGVSLISVPGAIAIGIEQVRKGDYTGLLNMMPIMPPLAKMGKLAGKGISRLQIFKSTMLTVDAGAQKVKGAFLASMDTAEINLLRDVVRGAGSDVHDIMLAWSAKLSKSSYLAANAIKGGLFGAVCRSGSCFVGGTQVTTRRGLVGIETVTSGDVVLGWDEAIGCARWGRIEATRMSTVDEVVEVGVRGTGTEDRLVSTVDHPYLVVSDGNCEWVEAGLLQLDDLVVCADGGVATVVSVSSRSVPAGIAVYQLSVPEVYTFAVGAGRCVVHNACLTGVLAKLGAKVGIKQRAPLLRKLLTDEGRDSFREIWLALRESVTSSQLMSEVQQRIARRNSGALRKVLYDMKPYHHEMIGRRFGTKFIAEARDADVAHKLLNVIDKSRVPTGDVIFSAERIVADVKYMDKTGKLTDKPTKGAIAVRWGHTGNMKVRPPVFNNVYAAEFHDALGEAVEKSLIYSNGKITGIDAVKWKKIMDNVLPRFFARGDINRYWESVINDIAKTM